MVPSNGNERSLMKSEASMFTKNAAKFRGFLLAQVSKRALVVGGIALMLAPIAFAQSANTGAISGTVTEQSGAVVPQAKISATGESGLTRSTVSGPQGNYVLPLLPPGSYKVE